MFIVDVVMLFFHTNFFFPSWIFFLMFGECLKINKIIIKNKRIKTWNKYVFKINFYIFSAFTVAILSNLRTLMKKKFHNSYSVGRPEKCESRLGLLCVPKDSINKWSLVVLNDLLMHYMEPVDKLLTGHLPASTINTCGRKPSYIILFPFLIDPPFLILFNLFY